MKKPFNLRSFAIAVALLLCGAIENISARDMTDSLAGGIAVAHTITSVGVVN